MDHHARDIVPFCRPSEPHKRPGHLPHNGSGRLRLDEHELPATRGHDEIDLEALLIDSV
jgi:hypothetical protein